MFTLKNALGLLVLLVALYVMTHIDIENVLSRAQQSNPLESDTSRNEKIHITYVYYADRVSVETENFYFFMNFAYVPCHPDIDFTIIMNSNAGLIDKHRVSFIKTVLGKDLERRIQNCSKEAFVNGDDEDDRLANTVLIWQPNIRHGSDLCTHMNYMATPDWQRAESLYKYFGFINASARGPFMPKYWLREW